MTFDAIDAWWWPYLFILVAGWLATDAWRYAGVALARRLDEGSQALVFARCIATALVAAVISNLVVFPTGPLADLPLSMRVGAAAAGFTVYLVSRKNVLAGIVVAEVLLISALWAHSAGLI